MEFLNLSLSYGTVPLTFKEAVVIPIQKKQGMDPKKLENYRPISLLPFPAKLLESHVATSLSTFLEATMFLDTHQAGFRPGHSTESVILSAMDDLKRHADIDCTQALVLLNLSVAFDTVNHKILLNRKPQRVSGDQP